MVTKRVKVLYVCNEIKNMYLYASCLDPPIPNSFGAVRSKALRAF